MNPDDPDRDGVIDDRRGVGFIRREHGERDLIRSHLADGIGNDTEIDPGVGRRGAGGHKLVTRRGAADSQLRALCSLDR